MKKEFIMVDLTTGGKAIIRISLIEDIYDDCDNGVFQKSIITSIADIVTGKSKISSIRKVKKGERISYGNEKVNDDKKIAIIPVGYSHGYMRQLRKEAYVLIKGIKVEIIGKILMDQMYIDVSELNEVNIGDEVVLLGDGVEAEKVAQFSETIADDVISKISPRIERVFIKERSSE